MYLRRDARLHGGDVVAPDRLAQSARLWHRIRVEFFPDAPIERFEVAERTRPVTGRVAQRHQPPQRVLAEAVHPEQRLGIRDRRAIIERRAVLVDQRDQVRRMEAAQPFAFDDDPVFVEVFGVIAAIERDRGRALPVSR